MGCGSAKQVSPQQNVEADRNGVVKGESPPPRQKEQQSQPLIKEIKQDSPKEKRKGSAKSKSSSGSSSRSSSAKSVKSRPETSPGGNEVSPAVNEQPVNNEIVEQQQEVQQQSEKAVESDNNGNSSERPEETSEQAEKAESGETVDETTTQGASVIAAEEINNEEEHEKPNFSEDVLKEFVEVQNQVKSLEEKDSGNNYEMKHSRLVELHKNLGASQENLEKLKAQTAKEYQDVVDFNASFNMRSMFINQAQMNAEYQKEQKEYLDAVNKQEIAEQGFENLKAQYKKLYDEVIAARNDQEELNKLRSKEEELLGRIFNDSYGSDKEWKLEMELDLLGQRKDRINAAFVRWRAAHVYLDTAAKQLSWSTRRWAQIATHRVTILVVKYQMVAETRNHLIAAQQNISSAHGNIKPVNIPYLTDVDLKQLHDVTSTIFNDVNIPEKYQNSYHVMASLFSKCSHLLQWVDQVVKETISKDLAEVKREYHEKAHELKEERMSLIKAIVKEKLGVELEMEITKDDPSTEESPPSEAADIAKPGEVAKEEGDEEAPEPDDKEGVPEQAPPSEGTAEAPADGGEGSPADAEGASKRVPLSELAPAPAAEDLFGNIDQLKKQHEEELAEFEKAQEMNKARVQQGLQEKLRARRSRRRKIEGQETEANQLTQGGDSSEPPPPSEMGL